MKIEDDVLEPIRRNLKQRGFRKKQLIWNKACSADWVYVFEIQRSAHLGRVLLRIAPRFGLFIRPLVEAVWGTQVGDFVRDVDCVVRFGCSQMRYNADDWFSISSREDMSRVRSEVERTVTLGLESLDRLRSWNDAFEFMNAQEGIYANNPASIIYRAMLLGATGEPREAVAKLLAMKDIGAEWLPRIDKAVDWVQRCHA